MKMIAGSILGFAAVVAAPSVLADAHSAKTKSATTTTTTDSTVTSEPAPPPDTSGTTTGTTSTTTESIDATGGGPRAETGTNYGYPASTTATATTVTTSDSYAYEEPAKKRPHVRGGIGLNVFGTAGTKDSARLGLGGRVEYVLPFGLAVGGSYTVHATSEFDRTGVRPLHGEVGWAFPIINHFEVRPLVGLGYAFATVTTNTDSSQPVTTNQSVAASGMAFAGGFDFAPGAKISYVARGFEVFTLPKYHFITDNNFLGVEVGAGARF